MTVVDRKGDQAIHWSAWRGYKEITELLLDAGTNINARGSGEWTALLWAARYGKTSCVELLLNRGARVEDRRKNDHAWNALMFAAYYNKPTSSAILILDAGADINAKDGYSKTTLWWVAEAGNLAAVELFLRRGAEVQWSGDLSPLQISKDKGHTDVVRLLEDYRDNPHKYKPAPGMNDLLYLVY